MRRTLTAAAALAPLWMMANAGHALATTTISTGRTTAISTATANNGAPDDIDIASGGSITLSTPGAAATINSSNKITNEGTITFTDTSNAVGVLINGGQTGSFTNSGTIAIKESSSPADTNGDGVVEAPFAVKGTHNNYGVLVQGGSPFVGDIINAGGTIQVTGNNSFGISVEAPLTGNLTNTGTIAVTGDHSIGLRETNGVSGNVTLTGSTSAIGLGSQAAVLSGDVGGRVAVYGTITSTAYGATTRSTLNSTQQTIQSTLSQVQQGGSALTIGGNVAGGVFISGQPANSVSGSTTDSDGDGTADASQGTASIVTYGSAPGVVIGAAGRDVALGAVQLTTTPANTYGLIIGGSVSGAGVEDGVSATALQIGDSSGSGTVHIAGGLKLSGTANALAYGADATGIHILVGSTVPDINISGAITATTASPLPNATTGAATPYTGNATGLIIDSGASVNSLNVTGTITAAVTGDQNSARAVIDRSGGVSLVNLTGHIVTAITPTTATAVAVGAKTGLDLSQNTAGVTLNMSQAAQAIITSTTTSGTTTTTVATGPVVQNTTGAPITSSTTSGSTTTTTVTPAAPTIIGDVLLGSGPNSVNILAGGITGALQLGSNTAGITIDNGGYYNGALSYGGSALSVNVVNGSLTTTNPVTLNATSLKVGANGTLNFAIDPANNRATNFLVNGAATIASGAKFGINLISNLTGPQTYQLVKATSLSVGGADASLASDVPYLFFASIQSNQAAGTINLTVRQKTASEMGLGSAEAAALPAIYAALPKDTTVQQALFAQYQRSGFLNLYDQLLPDYSGGAFRAASVASRSISRLTAEPNQIENPTGSRGAWAQQIFIGSNQGQGDSAGFRAGGFAFVGGVETGGFGFGAVGATAAFMAVNISNPNSPGDNRIGMSGVEAGVYWNGESSGFTFDARLAAGYDFFSGRRQFLQSDATSGAVLINRRSKSSWDGYSLTGHFGAAYQIDLTPTFFVRPVVRVDYFTLNQGGYSERGGAGPGGDAFDLTYGSTNGNEFSGTASVVFGAKLGRGLVWRPQLELGVRDVFSGTPGDITARFTGGNAFTVSPGDLTGPLGVARFKLKASSEYYEFGIEAGAEAKSRYGEGDAKLTVRVLF